MSEKLLETIRQSIIGKDHVMEGPFGPRRLTYADYTASGRSLDFIEDFIQQNVMPTYANTHTESSGTGLQTTRLREEARAIIHKEVGGNDDDVVIFVGSGATGAINKLIDILNIRIPNDLDKTYSLHQNIPGNERPVVFIGPFEHHSNELPWRESIADVVVIDEDENGRPDLILLEEELLKYAERPLKIGSFSAASNVTGIGSTKSISKLLHRHGAYAFWDFAAAAPYVPIDVNCAEGDAENYKDAVFLSPHKFIGGPGTPGVLIVKKHILRNSVPSTPGGGTVAYVGPTEHVYLKDKAHREEGGTPDIIGAIRAGLVFQLKAAVSDEVIQKYEGEWIRRALEHWKNNPNLEVLGNAGAWRLSILSFRVRDGKRDLHHNFVVRLLSDLFGLQARGGCSCAGPYGHRLLHIDVAKSKAFQSEILKGCEGIKPGWTRINFNYFISETTFQFILDAVDFVAEYGSAFLPLYSFDLQTGLWQHIKGYADAPRSLFDISYANGSLEKWTPNPMASEDVLPGYLHKAHEVLVELRHKMHLSKAKNSLTASSNPEFIPLMSNWKPEMRALRWFSLPEDELGDVSE